VSFAYDELMLTNDEYADIVREVASELLIDLCAISQPEVSDVTLRKIHALNVAALQQVIDLSTPIILRNATRSSDS